MIEYIDKEPENQKRGWDCGWNGSGWYFWDETWAGCYGPYESAAIAQLKMGEYTNYLDEEYQQ